MDEKLKAGNYLDKFNAGASPVGSLIKVISTFFEERQNLYDQIASTPKIGRYKNR